MALEDMLKVLDEEGRRQRREVKERAQKEKEAVLKEAQAEGERLKQKELETITFPLEREKAKILNQAKLEIKKRLAEAQKELLNQVFLKAKEKVGFLRNSPRWPEIFKSLLEETIEKAPANKATIKVDQEDQKLAHEILSQLNFDHQLEVNSSLVGGATITSEDGKITLINTLDSRLKKVTEFLKPLITSALFGDGDASRL